MVYSQSTVTSWAENEGMSKPFLIAKAVENQGNHRALNLQELFVVQPANSQRVAHTLAEDAGIKKPRWVSAARAGSEDADQFLGSIDQCCGLSSLFGSGARECAKSFERGVHRELLQDRGVAFVVSNPDWRTVASSAKYWRAMCIEIRHYIMVRALVMFQYASTCPQDVAPELYVVGGAGN